LGKKKKKKEKKEKKEAWEEQERDERKKNIFHLAPAKTNEPGRKRAKRVRRKKLLLTLKGQGIQKNGEISGKDTLDNKKSKRTIEKKKKKPAAKGGSRGT